MPTAYRPKRSETAGRMPSTSEIAIGELFVNAADQKLYSRDSNGIFEISPAAGGGASDGWLRAYTTSTFNSTNTTTFATVAGLTGLAAGTYLFEVYAIASVPNASADSKLTMIGVNATEFHWLRHSSSITTVPHGNGTSVSVATTTTDLSYVVQISGRAVLTAGGSIEFQFAQNTANATPSSILSGCVLQAYKVL